MYQTSQVSLHQVFVSQHIGAAKQRDHAEPMKLVLPQDRVVVLGNDRLFELATAHVSTDYPPFSSAIVVRLFYMVHGLTGHGIFHLQISCIPVSSIHDILVIYTSPLDPGLQLIRFLIEKPAPTLCPETRANRRQCVPLATRP